MRRTYLYDQAWKPALVEAGLSADRFKFHSLRHFCARCARRRNPRSCESLFSQVRGRSGDESACTPDSVRDLAVRWRPSISAGGCPTALAAYPGSNGRVTLPLLGLAPDGVYRSIRVAPDAGALLPHRFTLTCAPAEAIAIGGLLSVALSCGSPRLGVTQHPALRSPDVPRTDHRTRVRTRPPGRLATATIEPPRG